jgi:serine/threonine-protein kinase
VVTDPDAELAAGRLGRTVGGRWRLDSVLGVGGMAAVYAGRDGSGAVAAIKILHPEMGVRREVRERFLREGYVANRIGHPGVVQALEHGETGDEVFLAMELLPGETLRARVKRHGRLPIAEVLDYADQILDVLAIAHDKGIVHRDLKPDNLFVLPDGRIKILDFGLARLLDGVPAEHRTRTGVALGTLAYMAPEQALGRRAEIDGRVDIFALGATMFRVLSGRRVHEAESEAELLMAMASRPAPPLAVAVPGISPAIASVVDLALAFSRDARYPDARTMQGDVRALRQGQPAAYASARLSSRDEATRAEVAPTTSQRTQPLSVTMGSQVPGASSTLPMPVNSLGVIATAPGYGVPVAQPPQSPRTAPLAAHGPGAVAPGAAALPGPASFATTMPSTQPPLVVPAFATSQPAVTPAKQASRGSLIALLALAFVGVALAGGAGAWYYFAGPNTDAAATPAPSAPALPENIAPLTTVASPPSEPAKAELVAEAPGAASRKGSSKKQDGVAEPAPSASASLTPTPPPGASAADPSPTASSSTGASKTAPPPSAPSAPSPSAAPPAPTSPAEPAPTSDAKSPPPPKRNRGRGRN